VHQALVVSGSRLAHRFFKDWFGWVSHSRLKPMIALSRMLQRHLENLLG